MTSDYEGVASPGHMAHLHVLPHHRCEESSYESAALDILSEVLWCAWKSDQKSACLVWQNWYWL